MYNFFGERVSPGIGVTILGLICVCLFLFKLRTLLFLTILALLLTGLDTPLYGTSRLLRWPFLVGLVTKGVLSGLARGFRPTPILHAHRLLIVFSALALVSAAWSIGPSISLAQALMMITLWIGVFVVLWNNWSGPEQVTDVCLVLFRVAVIIFTAEIISQLKNPGAAFGAGRYQGLFTNPNGLGLAATFFAPFVFWRFYTADQPMVRRYSFVLGLFIVICLLLSGSRSGFLGMVVCMGCILTHLFRARMVLFGLFVALPLAAWLFLGERLGTQELEEARMVRSESLGNLSDRIPMWEQGSALVMERPFVGYGFGMSRFADLGVADGTILQAVERLRGTNYHNSHLQVALDLGFVGLILFWVYTILVIRAGLRLFFRENAGPLHFAGVVFFGTFLALTGDSFVHGWVFSPGSSLSILYWLTGAVVLRTHHFCFAPATVPVETAAAPVPEPSLAPALMARRGTR